MKADYPNQDKESKQGKGGGEGGGRREEGGGIGRQTT